METDNLYYYFFYVMAVFSRSVNKRDKDYAFKALAFVTVCTGLNILTIIFLLVDFRYNKAEINFICGLLMAGVFIINYYILFHGGKGNEIITSFDKSETSKKWNRKRLAIVIAYIVLSFVTCGITAYLTKENLVTPLFG